MSKDLKDRLIRLGSTNPELREHIRPILSSINGASLRDSLKRVIKQINRGSLLEVMGRTDWISKSMGTEQLVTAEVPVEYPDGYPFTLGLTMWTNSRGELRGEAYMTSESGLFESVKTRPHSYLNSLELKLASDAMGMVKQVWKRYYPDL